MVVIQERPPALARTAGLQVAAETMAAEQALQRDRPDESFPGNFLIGSARTSKLQAGRWRGSL